MSRSAVAIVLVCSAAGIASSRATVQASQRNVLSRDTREDVIQRADVWIPTNVETMDLRRGPAGPGAFGPNALVECTWVDAKLGGKTPKFECVLPGDDHVKVKYGADNGEVYAEVAATRLLWALGFGADAMYPVRVRCKGCPADSKESDASTVRAYEFAAIERKTPGRELVGRNGSGWEWSELEALDQSSNPEARAQRDALRLLAAVLQHTDSKREQQRLICLDTAAARPEKDACAHALLLISDVGRTFGKANAFNRDRPGSVDLDAWRDTDVWAGPKGCRARIHQSLTGTLDNPVVSEAGRRFLLSLLQRLSDAQLRDLFTVARFPARSQTDMAGEPGREVDAWVDAFKAKVAQIAGRTCE
ncbi:MAG: hypothetical protein ABL986_03225 [Vicinamibacterales bacterium]